MIVLDASVVIKLFKSEEGTSTAQQIIDQLLHERLQILAPSLIQYECLSAALHVEHPFDEIAELFEHLVESGMSLESPTRSELNLAEKIATTGTPGGGFPALFDSIYHAMAIERGGTLITADERHVRKSAGFGHAMSLVDWRPE